MKKPFSKLQKISQFNRGFTLIELLVVITIIVVLMSAGALGVRNLTSGKGTAAALANCEAIFSEAQAIAIGKGTNTRVLVDINNPADKNFYLRKLVVAVEDFDPVTNIPNGQWSIASRGYVLPDGVYFSRLFSVSVGANILQEVTANFTNLGAANDANNRRYLAYEFNNQGMCNTPGARFIIGAGSRNNNQEPQTQGRTLDFAGFAIWTNGTTSALRDPNTQMGIPVATKNF